MADYNSGLPIRSESDGVDEKVVVKIIDGVPGGTFQMSVDSDKNAHVELHGNDPAGLDRVLILSEEGRMVPRGDYNAASNTKPGSAAQILHARVAAPTEANQTFRPTGVASSVDNAKCADVAIRDESGNPFTADNPLPVTLVDSEGSEVNSYATSAAVAAGASVNHDYTVTALKRLKLSQIHVAGSGKMKAEVKVETAVASGIFNNFFVKFNSTASPNIEFPVIETMTVAAGVRVRVTIMNKDNQSQDLYSTICGHEID